MNVEFSNRAVADIHKISIESLAFGEVVARAVELRIHAVIARIATHPRAAEQVADRPDVHVVPLVRYPYRVLDDRVRILHIRHTSRQPWMGNR
jgi:toxin ParE1/3/4